MNRGQAIREQSVAVSALEWIRTACARMRNDIVMHHGRLDEVLFTFILSKIGVAYSSVTGFIWAHLMGVVSKAQLAQRQACCGSCKHKKTDHLGVTRCHGYNGQTCGCSMKRWWKPAYLSWQIRLKNRVCPQGYFGRKLEKEFNDVNRRLYRIAS